MAKFLIPLGRSSGKVHVGPGLGFIPLRVCMLGGLMGLLSNIRQGIFPFRFMIFENSFQEGGL